MPRCDKHKIIGCTGCKSEMARLLEPRSHVYSDPKEGQATATIPFLPVDSQGLRIHEPLDYVSAFVSDAIQLMANIADDDARLQAMYEFLRFEYVLVGSLVAPSRYDDMQAHITGRMKSLVEKVDEHRNLVTTRLATLSEAAGGN